MQLRPNRVGAVLKADRANYFTTAAPSEREQAPSPRIADNFQTVPTHWLSRSSRLRNLAPLPTTTPESARLCALVMPSYRNPVAADSATGLGGPVLERRNNPSNMTAMLLALAFVCYGGLRKDPFGDAGFLSFRSANLV